MSVTYGELFNFHDESHLEATCRTCGAIIPALSLDIHADWHEQLSKETL